MMRAIPRLCVSMLALVTLSSHARETPPPPGPPHRFQLPALDSIELANGLHATFVPFGTIPKVAIVAVVRAGDLDAATQTWLPEIVADMLKEGTEKRSAEEMNTSAALMGGDLAVSADSEQTTLSIDALSDQAPRAVELIADVLLHPRLPQRELPRIIQNHLRNLSVARTQPQAIAGEAFAALLYPDHPFGRTLPSNEQLQQYSSEDVRRFYQSNFGAARTRLYVAGQFDRAVVEAAIRKNFATWARGPASLVNPPTPIRKRQVRLIDRPGAPQSTLRLGVPVIDPTDENYMQLSVANTVLGGALTSRITANLRENKGWAYSPRAAIDVRYRDATWIEAADVTTSATALALIEIFKEIERLRMEPPSATELAAIKNYRNGLFVISNATRGGLISQLIFMDLLGLPSSWLPTFVDRLYAVTPQQVSAAVNAQLVASQMSLVVVGDMKLVRDSIKAIPQLRDAQFLE